MVEAGKAAELAAQLSRFLLQELGLSELAHGEPQLIEQTVSFDHVAVGAEIHGIDRRVDYRNSRDENKNRGGRYFLAVTEQLDSIHLRHADVGNNHVKNLSGQAALC